MLKFSIISFGVQIFGLNTVMLLVEFISIQQNLNLLLKWHFLMPLKYHVFKNTMGSGAFALLEQMIHFP